MPTYIYKCEIKKCPNEIFEVIRSFTDSSVVKCPECDVIASRQITSPTVIYKGSGFYTTDYGSGSKSTNTSSNTNTTSNNNNNKSKKSDNKKSKKTNKNE
ncbi:MAG: FmdB family transcriptional regulator [Chloroflexi bacterium]|nr:FmdB family transcriptional regulator [Chloroflexota bacterium]|tara:strand:- start:4957 stop:5256 length:300 start_codon:yes stop_codon:yes gene_type:complete